MNHRLTAYALLLLVSIIWGVAGPVIKYTLSSFPPLVFLVYRMALSSLVAGIVWTARPPRIHHAAKVTSAIILHSFFAVVLGLGLLFFGFDKTTSLTGTVISAMGPIAVAIAGVLFLHERITGIERVGIGIALVGTLVIILSPLLTGNGGTPIISLEGNILIILALLADAIGTVVAKEALRARVPAFFLTNVSFVIAFFVFIPILVMTTPLKDIVSVIASAPVSAHLGVWYMAFLSGTLAYTLQKLAMKSIEIGEVAVFNYLFPIWAAPLALWWLGEKITLPFVAGAAVIATGVVIAEYKRRQKKRKRK